MPAYRRALEQGKGGSMTNTERGGCTSVMSDQAHIKKGRRSAHGPAMGHWNILRKLDNWTVRYGT